jgi:superfamily II DNA or RNA helicase
MMADQRPPFSVDADEGGLVVSVLDRASAAWNSFQDATADVAEPLGRLVRIPRWAAATLTWWWATEEARHTPPLVTERARRVLSVDARRASRLADVLDADLDDWSRWPVTVRNGDSRISFGSPAEFGFQRDLLPFQADQVARLLNSGDGCNFSVPGSGKTTVAYAVWAALRAAGLVHRTVVVAPLSAHEAWEVEAANCFVASARPRLHILPPRPAAEIVVLNYEALQDSERLENVLAWLREAPSMVVLDEAHRAKAGRTGLRGSAALALADAAGHRLILTGTPAPNGVADLAAMFDLAWPGSGRALIRDGRSRRCFVRARKSDLGLPPQRMHVERVPMSVAHSQLYTAMTDAAVSALADPAVRDDLSRVGRIVMLLLQAATDPAALLDPAVPLSMTGDEPDRDLTVLARRAAAKVIPGKFVRVRQIVDENSAAGMKTLVWSSFRHHVDALHRLLDMHQPAVVVGDLAPGPLRASEIDRFRADPNCKVLIATPQTLGEGVSLHQACQHQVHVDRTYNAGVFLQALDRTHRLGLPPDAACTVTLLVTEASIDERVEARLARKVAAMSAMLDDPDLIGVSVPDVDEALTSEQLLLGVDASEALADLFGA